MQRIADYQIISTLGSANHGELYLVGAPARLGLGDDVVTLKVLDGRSGPQMFRRLTRELRAFAATRSDHLVEVYEAGQEGDVVFYVMRHYPDGTLAAPAKPLTRSAIVRVVRDAARAAHDLHEAGIAHRDIRPENIFCLDRSGKLGELGLAQLISPSETVTGVGHHASIEYLDPSILLGGRASRATDIWALGLTLHRALTGTSVYPRDDDTDVLRSFRTVLSTSPQLHASLADGDRRVIERCLSAPTLRYSTAADLAGDLDAIIEATP